MKKIGILGGVGPQATAYIYSSIVKQASVLYGAVNNDDYPYVVVASVPIPDFISDKNNIPLAKQMMVDAGRGLVDSGCSVMCIGSNTVHILLDDLHNELEIPFLSMIDLVAAECKSRNYSKVALLGTPVLIESGLYKNALSKLDIELITPTDDQELICDEVIRCIIADKTIDQIKNSYISVLDSMFDQGVEAIILGCTELPMVLNYEALGKRIISSDEILAKGIVDYYYQT